MDCGRLLSLGDWPYCKGIGYSADHDPPRDQNAQNFTPIVIDQCISDPSKFNFPGSNNPAYDPIPSGYRRIEIRNMREADHITRQINASERAQVAEMREHHRLDFEARKKQRRDGIRARISGNAKAEALFRAVCARVDSKDGQRFGKTLDPRFNINALNFNSSNREGHCDESTGWRNRKV